MAALTTNADRKITIVGPINELPVHTAVTVFQGALLSRNASTGGVQPLVAGGTPFAGIAHFGGNVNPIVALGDERIQIVEEGILHGVTVAGASDGFEEIDEEVYANTDNDLTLDDDDGDTSPTAYTHVGRIYGFDPVTNTYSIYFKSSNRRIVTPSGD